MQNNKEYFYNKYKRLIPRVIRDINCQYRNEDEYQSYYDFGELGLLMAINNFDFSKEETTTYFYNSIKNSILHYFYYKSLNLRKINYLELVSLDQSIFEGANNLSEIIEDENVNIENEIVKNELYETLYKAIDTLKPTYKDIICKYYGIKSKRYTLQELADIYNISRQAINVKRENALKKLKQKIIKYGVSKNDL